jgi:hypothetical protein
VRFSFSWKGREGADWSGQQPLHVKEVVRGAGSSHRCAFQLAEVVGAVAGSPRQLGALRETGRSAHGLVGRLRASVGGGREGRGLARGRYAFHVKQVGGLARSDSCAFQVEAVERGADSRGAATRFT